MQTYMKQHSQTPIFPLFHQLTKVLTRDVSKKTLPNQATLEADSSRNASLELSWHQSPMAVWGLGV